VTGAQDPKQIEREIEQTREELGETVEALAKKTDVKAQAQRKVEDTKASISEKKDQLLGQAKQASPDSAAAAASQAADKARANPVPTAALGAFAAGFLFGRLTKR
jgi:ElaB/YqjD/DUF883 family membrane-anchored ribosome-binding protein